MKVKEKQRKMMMEKYGNIIAGNRHMLYADTQKLEDTLQAMLELMASRKQTETIYFVPLRGIAKEMKVRVVYFNEQLRVWNPNGTLEHPYFWCIKLVRLPADWAADIPGEWALEDVYGDALFMRDLTIEDLMLLADRMFDEDCSLDFNWTTETRM